MSTFFRTTDELQYWRYRLKEFIILHPDGSTESIDTIKVNDMDITYNYEKYLYPIFHVQLVLDPDTYYKILEEKKDIKFKVRIDQFYSNALLSHDTISIDHNYINCTFDLILDDDEYDTYKSLRQEGNSNLSERSSSTKNSLRYTNNIVDLYLYRSDIVDAMNTEVNDFLTSSTVLDGIQFIATKTGLKRFLMAKPENTKVYTPLVIPPMKAKDAIQWLDSYYGLYKQGMMFFVDFIGNSDKDYIIYIIPYSGSCRAWKKNETKEVDILVPKKSNSFTSDPCMLKRSGTNKKYYVICSNDALQIRNEATSINEITSLDITTVDAENSTVKSTATKSSKKSKHKTHVKTFNVKSENEWVGNYYEARADSLYTVIETVLSNYDVKAITPNKRLRFVFEETAYADKYNGNYIITNASVVFSKAGDSYVVDTTVICRKAS